MFDHPARTLKKRAKIISIVGVVVGVLAMLASFMMPLEYRADAQVLIISQTRYGVDPYTVVRSAERVGENIAQVMETQDFYQKVVAQKRFGLDTSRFEHVPERTQRKRWAKALDGSVVFGTGVLNVSAYHKDPAQAEAFANAAAAALVEKGWEYVGGDVTMKIVNDAVVTRWPARPNVLLNTILGLIVGMVLMSALVLARKKHIV